MRLIKMGKTAANSKLIGTFYCETSDWSAAQIASVMNEFQSKTTQPLVANSGEFEQYETEFQVLLFSTEPLNEAEINQAIKGIKQEF